ncbi:MAG: phosphoribosylglycinamide formyltransferase [Firmicutes bacterium]|jgi:phosphoribosylglycinamide formyltransferase-1|nr:phosphoribosylglycinamide formyltransferase [Bacillota bacterium]
MKKIAVLASGNGSNLQAIIDAMEQGKIKGAEVKLVVSDKKDAYALKRAQQKNIATKTFLPAEFTSREDYDQAIVTYLQDMQIDLVVLAGFMRLLAPLFVAAFPNRIMNIHPSLLPAFPGACGVADALAYGVKVTGCTVHFVDEGMDTGPIILQESLPVYDHDTVESLQQRIHVLEHRLYPQAIALWVQGKIKLEGRRCLIDDN